MAWKKAKRAQSSLEYLLTYGWALVLIASLVAVLALVVGGGVNSNTCTTFLTMLCKGVGAEGDTLMLVLQNSTGQKITINPYLDIKFDNEEGHATVTYNGTEHVFDDVTINAGDEFTISAIGMVHAEEVSITYVEGSTGLTRTITSTIGTDAPDTIEISNDAIDNDGDGLTDCEEFDLGNCEYVVMADQAYVDTTIAHGTGHTIDFGAVTGSDGYTPLHNGPWAPSLESPPMVAFYVNSYTAGTIANVAFGSSAVVHYLEPGWNHVTISTNLPISGDDLYDVTITATEADLTISGNPRPRVFLTLNEP